MKLAPLLPKPFAAAGSWLPHNWLRRAINYQPSHRIQVQGNHRWRDHVVKHIVDTVRELRNHISAGCGEPLWRFTAAQMKLLSQGYRGGPTKPFCDKRD